MYLSCPDYRHALTLRRANTQIVELIPVIYSKCKDEFLRNQLEELLLHLDFWFVQFDEEEKRVTSYDQIFKFVRASDFPSFPVGLIEYVEKITTE